MNNELNKTTVNMEIDGRSKKLPSSGEKRSCRHYMEDKQRNCRMMAMRGQEVCPDHYPFDDNESVRKIRVNCPLDPKHTVFAYLLEKHLNKCNARKPIGLHPFYSAGINGGGDNDRSVPPFVLGDLDDTELMKLVDKIRSISEAYVPKIGVETGSTAVMQSEIENPMNGNEARRHLRQTSSILWLLEREDCFKSDTCFIEFGSGKGGLTYWVAKVVETFPTSATQSLVLIDRSSPRHKKDNKLQETDFKVERIRIDIEDLKLDEVPLVQKSKHLVAVSKHLCGTATDMALKCLLETNSLVNRVAGVVFATCCHHQCSWGTFVGKEYLKNWGFTEDEFRPLTCITSWNVCGTGTGKFTNNSQDFNSIKYSRLNLRLEERRLIGWNAKRILDYARCQYLSSHGFDSRCATFVNIEDTYENVCIVGLAKRQILNQIINPV